MKEAQRDSRRGLLTSPVSGTTTIKMTRTELTIQLLKVAIGLAFGAYFIWWSLEVLDRLTPEGGAPAALVGHIFKAKAAPVGAWWSLTP